MQFRWSSQNILQLIKSIELHWKTAISAYVPVGLINWLTFKINILLQEIWRSGIGWNDEITEDMMTRWRHWLKEQCKTLFSSAGSLCLDRTTLLFRWKPRSICSSSLPKLMSLVASKALVKIFSIIKLELLAATMGVSL